MRRCAEQVRELEARVDALTGLVAELVPLVGMLLRLVRVTGGDVPPREDRTSDELPTR